LLAQFLPRRSGGRYAMLSRLSESQRAVQPFVGQLLKV
jgi:hypothetical protein